MENINHELLRKFIARQTNDDETKTVLQWLQANNLSLEDLAYALKNPKAVWIFDQIDTPLQWEIVKQKMAAKPKVLLMRTLLRVAASVLILVAVTGIGLKVREYKNHPFTVSNEGSEVLKFILPDSSVVSLNKHSTMIYSPNFLKKRIIHFEGEAFFEIKRNVHHPFVIQTAESEVKVLGTSFSVITELKSTNVIVASGKVALYAAQQSLDTLFLEKGDKGVYQAQNRSLEKQKNKDLNYLAWKSHRLIFEKTPLANVITDLEKYFKVKINVKSPKIYQFIYTSEFINPTLAEVLKELELVLEIKSEVSENNILFYLK